MEIPTFIKEKLNHKKFLEIKENPHFLKEIDLLKNNNINAYYQYIIQNINLDPNNTQNSYVMWIIDKVKDLDQNKPVKIIKTQGSLPDIDVDVPASKRDNVIEYIKNKYGQNQVSQFATYQTMQGRGALTDTLRTYGISFNEIKTITRDFPDKAKVAGELQQMEDETGESTLIKYILENDKKGKFKEWCSINENGDLIGPLAKQFSQAIQLEGTKIAPAKHPGGILIGKEPLVNNFPMIYDSKTKTQICGFDLESLEKAGGLKLDCLGLSFLDKIMGICDILEYGEIQHEQ